MSAPEWARWRSRADLPAWTVGIEEEVMLVDPRTWAPAQVAEQVLAGLSLRLAASVRAETHAAALELATSPHELAGDAAAELAALRQRLVLELAVHGWRAAAGGTHPFAHWQETEIPGGARQQLVLESMRELARREPTFALHVHVGIPDPEVAVDVANRLRAHLPLLLALSANSPFWQGRDSGLASARTPLFQAFPRVGIPRRFSGYDDWVAAVDPLIAAGAFPEPTFLWWDVRLQPRLGTIEVRIMDAQTSVRASAGLTALVQSVARLEAEEGFATDAVLDAPEVLDENRFLAARDGMAARMVDPAARRRVPVATQLRELIAAARPHAEILGCHRELELAEELAAAPGAERQRALAKRPTGLPGVVEAASRSFTATDERAPVYGRPRAPSVVD